MQFRTKILNNKHTLKNYSSWPLIIANNLKFIVRAYQTIKCTFCGFAYNLFYLLFGKMVQRSNSSVKSLYLSLFRDFKKTSPSSKNLKL